MQHRVSKTYIERELPLPSSRGSVFSGGFDLSKFAYADDITNLELHIAAPALDRGRRFDEGEQLTYSVQHATDPEFADAKTLAANLIVQESGHAEKTTPHVRFPAGTERFVRVQIENESDRNFDYAKAVIRLFY